MEVAFDAFTRRIDEWWHPAYAPEGLERVEIEGEVGGRGAMHLADGTTYPWGTVTVWEPPRTTPRRSRSPRTPSTRARSSVHRIDGRAGDGTPARGSTSRTAAGRRRNVAGRARFTEWSILLDRFAAVADGRPVPDVPAWVTEGAAPASVARMSDVTVRDNPGESRFEAYVDGRLAGFSAYELTDDVITFTHTEVDDAFEGQGVGSALVRQELDAVRATGGLRVRPQLPVRARLDRPAPRLRRPHPAADEPDRRPPRATSRRAATRWSARSTASRSTTYAGRWCRRAPTCSDWSST